ncbi:ABC transporter substrate-binding protein [Kineococcus sp. SYSU DK006]|uniref:ABC transporter substrate-binding protein n=1 Tax=Kineococcus sp. SYSU DK006 TaxID=3383127 RepID=UPI003D7DAACB
MKQFRRPLAVGVSALALVGTLSACGGASEQDQAAAATGSAALEGVDTLPERVDAIAATVPAELRDAGSLTVGTDATMAPKEFLDADGKTFRGFDVDLSHAIGEVLGLDVEFVNAGFDTLLPGVQNGRYDMVASSAAPTLEREAVVDFVSVDRSGETLLVRSQDRERIGSLDDLCGLTGAAIKGSLPVEDLTEQSAKCEAGGQAPVTVNSYPDASAVNLALSSGRADAALLDTPTSAYQADRSGGKLMTTGPIYRAGLEGVFMPKGGGLAQPVADAVNHLIQTGTYAELLEKWGLPDSAVEEAFVNPATNGKAE